MSFRLYEKGESVLCRNGNLRQLKVSAKHSSLQDLPIAKWVKRWLELKCWPFV